MNSRNKKVDFQYLTNWNWLFYFYIFAFFYQDVWKYSWSEVMCLAKAKIGANGNETLQSSNGKVFKCHFPDHYLHLFQNLISKKTCDKSSFSFVKLSNVTDFAMSLQSLSTLTHQQKKNEEQMAQAFTRLLSLDFNGSTFSQDRLTPPTPTKFKQMDLWIRCVCHQYEQKVVST